MSATTRVDFHCHSIHSDGTLTPAEVARQLASDDVAFAALADHDTIAGLDAFRQAVARRSIGFLSGVEITTWHGGAETHLLAYGFDPGHPDLQATLLSIRQFQAPAAQSVAGSIRGRATPARNGPPLEPPNSAASGGRLDIGDAIDLIHRAGGKAFLAHPLTTVPDRERLRALLEDLKSKGLDGVEAFYGRYTETDCRDLAALARELGLLVSGGSDAHERRAGGGKTFGVEMPTELWKQFRDAVSPAGAPQASASPSPPPARLRMRRRHFLFHVVFPTFLAVSLFAVAMFAVFLPFVEDSLLERKREMIRELTNSAWSILAGYEHDAQAGLLTREEARTMAVARIETLRYGSAGKDYFWLQDMQPRMIMHPYRKDLNGQDVSRFVDARGNRIFVEFADMVREQGEGYVDYVWQWMDDPTRLEPKESFVKGFEPWGWIIGTGLYIEDVMLEIQRFKRGLLLTALGISVVVVFLLLYVLKQSLTLEHERRDAEEGLRESTARYQSLVEATTEGTLLVLSNRCRYGNRMMLEMLGCSAAELELLDLEDILPRVPENETAWEQIARLLEGQEPAGGFDGMLRRRDGIFVDCALGLSSIPFAAQGGLILLAKPAGAGAQSPHAVLADNRTPQGRDMSEDLPVGLFRAMATARGTVIAASPSAARLLRPPEPTGAELALSDVFPDAASYEEFLAQLQREGAAERRLHLSAGDLSTRTLSIRAVPVGEERGRPRFLDGVVADVTVEERRAAEREALIQRLQGSMLFLHEPVSQARHSAMFCPLDMPVREVARRMTAESAAGALIRSEAGEVMGIFTDSDLRRRVVAAGADLDLPIYRFMSSPLLIVPEQAEIGEALVAMEERGVHHVVIADDTGKVTGVVRGQELLQFPSYGPLVLAGEVGRAATVEGVVEAVGRTPGLAKALLDSGAQPDRVARMITSVCDAATERFITLAQAELGPAPAPYAFLALGSQGRQEQVLSSDQDNAIVYADEAADDPEAARYFQQLGSRVCGWLHQAGYPFCRGEVMAQNPRWCRPLADWKGYFTKWIRTGGAQQALEFSIFFDFRPVSGASELASDLRTHVHQELEAHPAFLLHLAHNALQYKPPLRLFGRILMGASAPEHPGLLNIKEAVAPLTGFARLYALRHGLEHTHTLERLEALTHAGVLTPTSHGATVSAYEHLVRLRLRHQVASADTGLPPDNLINHRKLGQLESALLNQAFAQIGAVQSRINHDFFGSAQH